MGLNEGTSKIMKGHNVIWSGEKDTKRNGVAIVVSPEIKDRITQIDHILSRVIKIKILLKGREIIQIYAHQVDSQDDVLFNLSST